MVRDRLAEMRYEEIGKVVRVMEKIDTPVPVSFPVVPPPAPVADYSKVIGSGQSVFRNYYFDGKIVKESEKAIRLNLGDVDRWIPISQITGVQPLKSPNVRVFTTAWFYQKAIADSEMLARKRSDVAANGILILTPSQVTREAVGVLGDVLGRSGSSRKYDESVRQPISKPVVTPDVRKKRKFDL
jgi:hypothetical protein